MATHLPPVSSPLADYGRAPTQPIGFGAHSCKPKCYKHLPIAYATGIPIMTSSSKHSYRFTLDGIELAAETGYKALLRRRIRLSDLRSSAD
ncbi:hypothetical protein MJO28_006914 [Puccinia striiformis f. sp. tritici]|uniref:Uncharacterized protein n=2 Tax=Puccinia striiformis TaxID=27350 RepID=A0A2S4VWC6_9BASI|nr:uncharacterized protein Pst134EA_031913 [Puccinia striiformis f. sp. tritici]POW13800.1 hypothetical protein PSTT_03442 [Puccinia striiformis]KAH9444448.1 hypothetical protein Pst134EA_031913 [Puccinia striiformis f. sp. tritici]KAH9453927.1 hypothetical protein Pst134EB_014027 [Puccinia striiformis f. sp. tritici]KAI7951230.1 hypothetical protein MJO28_006914 [Puccinia striiformis f. sp. tritici]KAI7955481.1 hypothetical protein MJO29_006880 [Puccinia striiformis f. sp. tritici]